MSGLGADIRDGQRLALERLKQGSAATGALIAALDELKPEVRDIDAPREPSSQGLAIPRRAAMG